MVPSFLKADKNYLKCLHLRHTHTYRKREREERESKPKPFRSKLDGQEKGRWK
uniref:Uncharacterized protein n=1 Tax=Rhinopithecus bieti TaxID=61621 RepID=A0A2K6LSM8_RHIBE